LDKTSVLLTADWWTVDFHIGGRLRLIAGQLVGCGSFFERLAA